MKLVQKTFLGLFLCVSGVSLINSGCSSPPSRIAFNTLASVQKGTIQAYDRFLDGVLAGRISTNNVPKVSQAFNSFQSTMGAALVLAQFSTNAPATEKVLVEAAKVTSAIAEAK